MSTTRTQGIIRIEPIAIKEYIDLTADPALIDLGKLKEVLLLPERYVIEQVRFDPLKNIYHLGPNAFHYAEVIVSSPDIPEVPQGEALPNVTLCCRYEFSEDFKTKDVSLADILINGVSAIKEEDKQQKVTIEIKEIIDNSGATE